MNTIQRDLEINKIYDHLQDDLSRKIFENRLLYSILGRPVFNRNVVCAQYAKARDFMETYQDQIILYGAGARGTAFAGQLNSIIAFCDTDAKKHNTILSGYRVISPAELRDINSRSKIGVIISVYDDVFISEIYGQLKEYGFSEDQILIGKELHRDQYFDDQIPLPRSQDEVFVDAGCLNFNTSLDFIKWSGGYYKKIIAFEPNSEQYPICVGNAGQVERAVVYNQGLWNCTTEISFKNAFFPGSSHIVAGEAEDTVTISAVRLDDILDGEEATFIKMDVEGAERKALEGARETIVKYRPKLAICIYHKPEDTWEIPAYVLSLHEDYKLYIRHYNFLPNETILYAI